MNDAHIDTGATVTPIRCEACGGTHLTALLGDDLKPDPRTVRPCEECLVPRAWLTRVESERNDLTRRVKILTDGINAAIEELGPGEDEVCDSPGNCCFAVLHHTLSEADPDSHSPSKADPEPASPESSHGVLAEANKAQDAAHRERLDIDAMVARVVEHREAQRLYISERQIRATLTIALGLDSDIPTEGAVNE